MGVRARIRKALEEDRRITRAFLYGSYAASPGEAQGSVHLLIVGSASAHDVGELLDPVEHAIRAEINTGTYETPARIEGTVSRLLDILR